MTLSSEGIQFGNDFYAAEKIEAAASYLYAFENFKHREDAVLPNRNVISNVTPCFFKSPGNQNKLSFRSGGEVVDFDFYLSHFAYFYAVQNVSRVWIIEGINVVLKQAFDDELMLQEMNYYNTPISI